MQKPIRHIDNLHTLVLVRFLAGAGGYLIGDIIDQKITEALHQLGLSAASDACNDFDLRGAHDILQLVQIEVTLNQAYSRSLRSYYATSYFAK